MIIKNFILFQRDRPQRLIKRGDKRMVDVIKWRVPIVMRRKRLVLTPQQLILVS